MSFAADVEAAAQFDQSQLAPHMHRAIVLPLLIFATTLGVYLAATTGAVLATVIVLKILPRITAGIFIAIWGSLAMTLSAAASLCLGGSTA